LKNKVGFRLPIPFEWNVCFRVGGLPLRRSATPPLIKGRSSGWVGRMGDVWVFRGSRLLSRGGVVVGSVEWVMSGCFGACFSRRGAGLWEDEGAAEALPPAQGEVPRRGDGGPNLSTQVSIRQHHSLSRKQVAIPWNTISHCSITSRFSKRTIRIPCCSKKGFACCHTPSGRGSHAPPRRGRWSDLAGQKKPTTCGPMLY